MPIRSRGPSNVLVVEAHRLLALESAAPIFLGRHAGCAMKRSRKAGLRGEMCIERYLGKRKIARCQFHHRVLQANAAYLAVRRDPHGECELACKMKHAVTRDF